MVRELLYNNLPLPLYRNAMDALAARHRATASNIANASTADYTPRRVKFEENLVEALDRRKRLMHTDDQHLPAPGGYKAVRHEVYREESEAHDNGANGVEVEEEMATLATNQIHYSLVAKRAGGLFTAVRTLSRLK